MKLIKALTFAIIIMSCQQMTTLTNCGFTEPSQVFSWTQEELVQTDTLPPSYLDGRIVIIEIQDNPVSLSMEYNGKYLTYAAFGPGTHTTCLTNCKPTKILACDPAKVRIFDCDGNEIPIYDTGGGECSGNPETNMTTITCWSEWECEQTTCIG